MKAGWHIHLAARLLFTVDADRRPTALLTLVSLATVLADGATAVRVALFALLPAITLDFVCVVSVLRGGSSSSEHTETVESA